MLITNLVFDDRVRNVLADSHVAILELDDALPFKVNAAMRQFDAQPHQIRLLEKACSKVVMHFDRAPDDAFRKNLLVIHLD